MRDKIQFSPVMSKDWNNPMRLAFAGICFWAISSASIAVASDSIGAAAFLQPEVTDVGFPATLTLRAAQALPRNQQPELINEIDGSNIPKVAGLEIQPVGENRTNMNVNGRLTRIIEREFRVSAERPGEYTIPAFDIIVQGRSYRTEPLTLTVRSMERVFVELELPREAIYVGEAVVAKVHIFLEDGVSASFIRGEERPIKSGDAFGLGDFDYLGSYQSQHNGERMSRATWQVLVTPLKAGEHPLRFEQRLSIRMPGQDRFRRNSFGLNLSVSRSQQISLFTPDKDVTVLPLPQADKPMPFGGAIGRFELVDTRLSRERVEVGEPLDLTVRIRGQGNFARIDPPTFEATPQWEVFTPESDYQTVDELGFKAIQAFTYTLVPQEPGPQTTPPLRMHYFDPDEREYRSIEIPPQRIDVTPGRTALATTTEVASPAQSDLFLPDREAIGSTVTAIRPTFLSPGFIVTQVGFGCLLAVALVWQRRISRLRSDEAFALRHRATPALREALRHAKAVSDQLPEFMLAAETSLRLATALRLGHATDAWTAADIRTALSESGLDTTSSNDLTRWFDAIEQFKYGGSASNDLASQLTLSGLEATVNRLLSH